MDYIKIQTILNELLELPKEKPTDNYEIFECQNRLKRIKDYEALATVLEENKHTAAVNRLKCYINNEAEIIYQVFLKYDVKPPAAKNQHLTLPKHTHSTVFKNDPHAQTLVLSTDLFRDFDDWLVLLHTVLIKKYKDIIVLTSNEINGECAKVTASFVPALVEIGKILHGTVPHISVYQGLEAFDFAGGKHEPPKDYSANMRMKAIEFGTPCDVKKIADLYYKFKSIGSTPFDLISIGKVADHDMIWLILDALEIVPNKDIVLGAKPLKSRGTNTNHPFYHLYHLRPDSIMLDSRYGNQFSIRKELFSKCISNSKADIDKEELTWGEIYFYELWLKLYEYPHRSKAFRMIAEATLQHLMDVQYDTGNFFDVYALMTAVLPEVPYLKKEIEFLAEGSLSERPECNYVSESAIKSEQLIKRLIVRYPHIKQLESLVINALTETLMVLEPKANKWADIFPAVGSPIFKRPTSPLKNRENLLTALSENENNNCKR